MLPIKIKSAAESILGPAESNLLGFGNGMLQTGNTPLLE